MLSRDTWLPLGLRERPVRVTLPLAFGCAATSSCMLSTWGVPDFAVLQLAPSEAPSASSSSACSPLAAG